MVNDKEGNMIKKEVMESYRDLYAYHYNSLNSIDQKVSNFLSVILITESIIAAYVALIIQEFDGFETVIMVLMLVIAAVLLAIAGWKIMRMMKPKDLYLPDRLDITENSIGDVLKKRCENIETAIKNNITLMDRKSKNLGHVIFLIQCAIILIAVNLILSLLFYLI